MNKLLVKSPAVSFESACMQLDAGASELYVGLSSLPSDNAVFTARPPIAGGGYRTHTTDEQFAKICAEAKKRGATVDLVANVQLLPFDADGTSKTKDQYVEYVKRGIALGANGIIVGDWGNLSRIRKAGITNPIVASVHLAEMNRYYLKLLEDLGVTSAVLPHHMKTEEIAELAQCSSVKLVAFAAFGCSFLESTCTLLHMTAGNVSTGMPCRSKWRNVETGQATDFLNVGEDCVVCFLDQLMKAGVYSVKIVGRELEPTFVAAITRTYVVAARLFSEGASKETILESLLRDNRWWKSAFCDGKKCRLINTDHYM